MEEDPTHDSIELIHHPVAVIVSRRGDSAAAIAGLARPRRSSTDANPLDGMLDDLEAPDADWPYGSREVSGGRSPYNEHTVPESSPRGLGVPRDADAMDGLIELAGMLDPEDWLSALGTKARG